MEPSKAVVEEKDEERLGDLGLQSSCGVFNALGEERFNIVGHSGIIVLVLQEKLQQRKIRKEKKEEDPKTLERVYIIEH